MFGFGKFAALRRRMEADYRGMFLSLGWDAALAREQAKQLMDAATKKYNETPAAKRDQLGMFATLLRTDSPPNPILQPRRDWLRAEGVRDEDVQWWWTMHHLERCALQTYDAASRIAVFSKHKDEGADDDAAERHVRAHFPMFGTLGDRDDLRPADRPLPFELKDRVNKAQLRGDFDRDEARTFTTMNAYIRSLIRAGAV